MRGLRHMCNDAGMTPHEATQKLSAAGLSDAAIAAAAGASPSTIRRVRNGTHQTTYDIGRKIVDMAAAVDILPALKTGVNP